MHCDQVFEILTRGPFPSGEADDAFVELHLAACHECRQLAEALRPAVELLHEALEPAMADELPGYRGVLPVADEAGHSVTVEAVMRRVGVLPARLPQRNPAATSWLSGVAMFRVAAAIVLGIGVGLFAQAIGLTTGLLDQDAKAPAVAAQLVSAASPLEIPPFQALASLSLPSACLKPRAEASVDERPGINAAPLPGLPRSSQLLCCADCHNDTRKAFPPKEAIVVALQHCQACHAGK